MGREGHGRLGGRRSPPAVRCRTRSLVPPARRRPTAGPGGGGGLGSGRVGHGRPVPEEAGRDPRPRARWSSPHPPLVRAGGGVWVCTACGRTGRTRRRAAATAGGTTAPPSRPCVGRARGAAGGHPSHALLMASSLNPLGHGLLFTFCRLCGCYSAARLAKLGAACRGPTPGRAALARPPRRKPSGGSEHHPRRIPAVAPSGRHHAGATRRRCPRRKGGGGWPARPGPRRTATREVSSTPTSERGLAG